MVRHAERVPNIAGRCCGLRRGRMALFAFVLVSLTSLLLPLLKASAPSRIV